jgi:hypothetical protein
MGLLVFWMVLRFHFNFTRGVPPPNDGTRAVGREIGCENLNKDVVARGGVARSGVAKYHVTALIMYVSLLTDFIM